MTRLLPTLALLTACVEVTCPAGYVEHEERCVRPVADGI